MLNLTSLVLRVPHITLSRGIPAETCAPAYGPLVIMSGSDAALRGGS
jgi:hypothetical protein